MTLLTTTHTHTQDSDDSVEAVVALLEGDKSKDVRVAVVQSLPLTTSTLPVLLHRAKDVNPVVSINTATSQETACSSGALLDTGWGLTNAVLATAHMVGLVVSLYPLTRVPKPFALMLLQVRKALVLRLKGLSIKVLR